MSDLAQLEEEERRGNAAKRLLEDPLTKDVFEAVELRYTRLWKGTTLGQGEEREKLYALYCGLKEFEAELTRMKSRGTLAARKLAEARTQGENGSAADTA